MNQLQYTANCGPPDESVISHWMHERNIEMSQMKPWAVFFRKNNLNCMYCSVFRKIPWYFHELEDSEEKVA